MSYQTTVVAQEQHFLRPAQRRGRGEGGGDRKGEELERGWEGECGGGGGERV